FDYDILTQTHACIDNVETILKASGSSIEDVVDITVFLVNMERDFAGFNQVYAERLGHVRPTRTTLEVGALPTPIAVELKVMAHTS
ncbi:MAG TPA: RidA family protein, partial [Candidatus Poseidoniales archaeon]|nr:RidA family protein [Candidatus Poseidoniales archaeon]